MGQDPMWVHQEVEQPANQDNYIFQNCNIDTHQNGYSD